MKRILEYLFTKLVKESVGSVTSLCSDKDGNIYTIEYKVIWYSFWGYEWISAHDSDKILAGNNQARHAFNTLKEKSDRLDPYQRGLEIILGDKLAHGELYRVLDNNEVSRKECINLTLQWARNIASTALTGKFQPFYDPNKLATVFTPYGCKQL